MCTQNLKKRLFDNIERNKDYLDTEYLDKSDFIGAVKKVIDSDFILSFVEEDSDMDIDSDYITLISKIADVYSLLYFDNGRSKEELDNAIKIIDILISDESSFKENGNVSVLASKKVRDFYKRIVYDRTDLSMDPNTLDVSKKNMNEIRDVLSPESSSDDLSAENVAKEVDKKLDYILRNMFTDEEGEKIPYKYIKKKPLMKILKIIKSDDYITNFYDGQDIESGVKMIVSELFMEYGEEVIEQNSLTTSMVYAFLDEILYINNKFNGIMYTDDIVDHITSLER